MRIIGTRHGEKSYETLLTREEFVRAIDMGNFYRIPADKRDLNYDKYFTDGSQALSETCEYTSQNTRRLSIEEIKRIISELEIIKEALVKKR